MEKKNPALSRAAAQRLTLRQLQAFVAVARAGSTMAAAREIALSQSATSASLNELEDLLGGRLFNRVGRRLVLNEHGRSMLPQARFLLDAARAMQSDFGRTGRPAAPRLRIAASTTIGNWLLPPVIASYRREVPDARIALEIGNTSQVAQAVARYEVDLGFIEGPTQEPHIRVQPWREEELVIVASPRHALARAARAGRGARGKVPLAALAGATWLLREPGSGTREIVERALQPHLHRLEADIELGSSEAIVQAAAQGLGLACVSRHAAEDMLKLGRVAIVPTALPPVRRTLYLVQHQRHYVSPTLERFIAHCLASDRKAGRR